MRTLSLASIIAESQQGEQAARRAAPAARAMPGFDLAAPPGQEKKPEEKARDTGQAATIEDQQRLEQEAEDKKKQAEEDARKVTMSAADSLQTIQQLDYTQTFLKLFLG
jgi:hypothetical protein